SSPEPRRRSPGPRPPLSPLPPLLPPSLPPPPPQGPPLPAMKPSFFHIPSKLGIGRIKSTHYSVFNGKLLSVRTCQGARGAPQRPQLRLVAVRMVTISSAMVGCTATVRSKSSLVAPILTAMAAI